MTIKKIKFAIVGCGRIAPKHAEAIREHEDAVLVAACDIVKKKAEEMAAGSDGCKVYTDYNEMLKQDIDVVSICTPHDSHGPITIASAKAKKNVLTEKPMALDIKEADEMIHACNRGSNEICIS